MLVPLLLRRLRSGAQAASPALTLCPRSSMGGLVRWNAGAAARDGGGVSFSTSSTSASTSRRRLLDQNNKDLFSPGDQSRSSGFAALLAAGTAAAAAAGALYVVSLSKGNEDRSGDDAASPAAQGSSSSSSAPPTPSSQPPCVVSPCAQPGAAPAAAPVDRAALLADLRAWLEAAGADVADVDIRPCEGNSAGVGVFATRCRGGRVAGNDDRGALATAGAVASSLARRLLPQSLRPESVSDGTQNKNRNDDSKKVFVDADGSPTVVLASFPLSLAVTPAAALADEAAGPHYARLLSEGKLADERALVMLFLAVERARGRSSRWAQWIAALPRDFSTPLHFSDEQLALLDGTTLGKAAASLRARLAAAWHALSPAAAEVAAAAGVSQSAPPPTLDDFKWAYSTFWSRGMAVPWPVVVEPGAAVAPAVESAADATTSQRQPRPTVAVEVVECILPGLDFCNHAPGASVRWTLWGGGGTDEESSIGEKKKKTASSLSSSPSPSLSPSIPDRVALVAPRSSAPRAGDELLIDYGDKSQEELLLLYGFAHATSSAAAASGGKVPGVLMVPCPLPAAPPPPMPAGDGGRGSSASSRLRHRHPQTLGGWDPDLEDRLELLRRRGLAPQVFLPVAGPEDGDEGERGGGREQASSSSWRWLWPSRKRSSSQDRHPASFLPEGVWDTLETFVLEPEFVRGALARPDAATPPRGGGGGGSENKDENENDEPSSDVERAGLRMAVLTTLARLLEGTVLTLEGPGGTGPLEEDVKWLEEQQQQASTAKKKQEEVGSGDGNGSGSSGGTSSAAVAAEAADAAIRRACVEYRATQKAAARRWLARARRAVDEQVKELEELMAK